ncbi:MAG: 50S ribosomal protein L36, partial [Planctomycetes bacterium]|nr:50S ribosomal protein L36 [Planctomycetota bacterium]
MKVRSSVKRICEN